MECSLGKKEIIETAAGNGFVRGACRLDGIRYGGTTGRSPCAAGLHSFLGLIGLLLYANTLRNGYAVDDGTVVSYNALTTQGLKAIPAIFTSSYRAGDSDPSKKERVILYRPLSVAMFAAEWQLSPGKPSPWSPGQCDSLRLTGFLLFLTLSRSGVSGSRRTKRNLPAGCDPIPTGPPERYPERIRLKPGRSFCPGIITLLFITHPIHTEVAANIKGLDEILSFLFVIAAVNCIAGWLRQA